MRDRARFFGKNPYWAKMNRNGEKWPKNRVFGLFKKIISLIFTRICVKWKFLWFINILQKIWFSSYSQKFFSANEISVFFNRQYFTNKLISDFDFWHVDRHEWKKQGSLAGFLMPHPDNSGSTGEKNFKIWHNERG